VQDANTYLQAIRLALNDNPHAREFYFPASATRRKEGSLRLGREFGYGLAGLQDSKSVIGSSYGMLVVANCFDRTGVQVDAKEWVRAIQDGITKARRYKEE